MDNMYSHLQLYWGKKNDTLLRNVIKFGVGPSLTLKQFIK